jgi:Fe-S cluster assembly protein SufD
MSDAALLQHYLDDYGRIRSAGANWLPAKRDEAIEVFRELGFPRRRQEEWKYTDVSAIVKRPFASPPAAGDGISAAQIDEARFAGEDCIELVFINGRFAPALSRLRGLPPGIMAGSLNGAARDTPALLEARLTQQAAVRKSGFVALNTALMSDGAAVRIAQNGDAGVPVHLLFVATDTGSPAGIHPRNLIVLEPGASATIVETHIGADSAEYLCNSVTEISVGNGAQLDYYTIQQHGAKGSHVAGVFVSQERDSRVDMHSICLGGSLIRNDLDVRLAAPGAAVTLNGLYMAGGRQHVDNHTRIDHEQPHTSSNEIYRGVLDGRARAVFNGKVVVHRDAQKTDARQSNANLLLSDDAEVDTKPELEIYADDVKCSHGATVGQLDQDMLFYLRSRAIPESIARGLLTFAFADEIIVGIRPRPIRDRLERYIVGRLPDAALIREYVQ